jgi:uncharacterized protein YecT (DUF1311 family)
MKLALVLLTLFLLTGDYAFAQKSKKPEPCANAQSQAEMNICWGKEYQAADATLNQVYRQLFAKLDDGEKAQLKGVEAAWLKYRGANCDFVADQFKGGTMRPMIAAMCLAEMTQNRSAELRNQIKDRDQ